MFISYFPYIASTVILLDQSLKSLSTLTLLIHFVPKSFINRSRSSPSYKNFTTYQNAGKTHQF